MFLSLKMISSVFFAEEVEEEAAVEAEEYFDVIEDDFGKGKVDLSMSDEERNSANNSPKKGEVL